MRGSVVVSGIV